MRSVANFEQHVLVHSTRWNLLRLSRLLSSQAGFSALSGMMGMERGPEVLKWFSRISSPHVARLEYDTLFLHACEEEAPVTSILPLIRALASTLPPVAPLFQGLPEEKSQHSGSMTDEGEEFAVDTGSPGEVALDNENEISATFLPQGDLEEDYIAVDEERPSNTGLRIARSRRRRRPISSSESDGPPAKKGRINCCEGI